MPAESVVLIHLLPLLGGAFVGLFGFRLREHSWKLAVPAILASFLLSIWTLREVLVGEPIRLVLLQPPAGLHGIFTAALLVDRLSAVMMVLITGVSAIVHIYSIRYMQGERGYARFYALLGLITSVLLGLVCSADLLMLFVCWQLVTWLLYLLLVYNYERPAAVQTAFKTFLILRLGDIAFLAGVLVAYRVYGTLEFSALFAKAAESPVLLTFGSGLVQMQAVTAITLLIFVGAMTKSAQFPLHVWLPDTMDTPTPVSALMHAGIVNAGGFLINRLAPLYGLAPETLHVCLVIGGLTAVFGAAMMLTQPDVKKMLGFSTMGQMGYMIMECGLGAFALAIFHLIAHGIFKATLFLYAGNVIHIARREPRVPPAQHPGEVAEEYPRFSWFAGFTMTLLLPLVILLVAHGLLDIPLLHREGAVIFLFFAWVTSSQVMLSLYRLRGLTSWLVTGVMVLMLGLVVLTYLWAGDRFTSFLYPAPGEAERYFLAAALPPWLFDLMVMLVAGLIVAGWIIVYRNIRGQSLLAPTWANVVHPRVYVWFWNRLYVDRFYAKAGDAILRCARRVDASLPEWLP